MARNCITYTMFVSLLLAALATVSVHAEPAPAPRDPRSMDNLADFQALNNALICLDNKTAAVCPPGGYLNETGKIPQFNKVDGLLYCNGGCANQTLVQLKCVSDVYEPFRFNNKATVADIRDTIKAACDPSSILFGNFTIKATSPATILVPGGGIYVSMTIGSVLSALFFM